MKNILIIGQGNIGTFIGATLSTNELITHFTRKDVSYPKDVTLNFTDRRSTEFRISKGKKYGYQTKDSLEHISDYDFIIIPVAHYHLRSLINSVNPYLVSKQIIVIMGNVWNDFDWLQKNVQNPYIFVFPNFGGAIVNNKLQGWLTPNFTTGSTNLCSHNSLEVFNHILVKAGFKPEIESNMKGWLMTHFAYNAGMLLEAAKQDGFQKMTKKFRSLKNMYATMQECMNVVDKMGVNVKSFTEGKTAYQAKRWSAIKTYFMFLLPGLAKSADATKNIEDWISYSKEIWKSAQEIGMSTPILSSYHNQKSELE
ncbi:MAG: 2-dehydropantoate 2-reductase N-terminal domain-containing protein [Flavobacteriaceae bacterium]